MCNIKDPGTVVKNEVKFLCDMNGLKYCVLELTSQIIDASKVHAT
jgi:hypothetical protein